MRIIFMGTPDFSVGTLEALVEAGHDVCPSHSLISQKAEEKKCSLRL